MTAPVPILTCFAVLKGVKVQPAQSQPKFLNSHAVGMWISLIVCVHLGGKCRQVATTANMYIPPAIPS